MRWPVHLGHTTMPLEARALQTAWTAPRASTASHQGSGSPRDHAPLATTVPGVRTRPRPTSTPAALDTSVTWAAIMKLVVHPAITSHTGRRETVICVQRAHIVKLSVTMKILMLRTSQLVVTILAVTVATVALPCPSLVHLGPTVQTAQRTPWSICVRQVPIATRPPCHCQHSARHVNQACSAMEKAILSHQAYALRDTTALWEHTTQHPQTAPRATSVPQGCTVSLAV